MPADIPTPRNIGLAVDTVGSYGREVIRGVMEFCHRNPHWTIAIEPRLWVYDAEPKPDQWDVDGLIIQAYDQNVVDRVRAIGHAGRERGQHGMDSQAVDDHRARRTRPSA